MVFKKTGSDLGGFKSKTKKLSHEIFENKNAP